MKKTSLTLIALTTCLAACSGGGGGGGSTTSAAPSTPSTPVQPAQPNVMDKPSEAQPIQPNVADKPSEVQHVQPNVENKPSEAWPAQPSVPQQAMRVYQGKKVNRYTGNGEWNVGYAEIKVPNITPNEHKIYADDDLVIVTGEKSITIADNDTGAHEITLLGEGGYYGYFRDTQDKKSLFKNFVYAIDNDFKTKAIPQELNAHYRQKDGFVFSANGLANSGGAKSEPNLQKQADVDLTFENGNATGTIIIRDGNGINDPVFRLSGDVKALKVSPTREIERLNFNIQENDSALMPIHFIDSQKDANDLKYVVGATKADNWSGVLGVTKEEDAQK